MIELIAYNHNYLLVTTNREPIIKASPVEDKGHKQKFACSLVEDYLTF